MSIDDGSCDDGYAAGGRVPAATARAAQNGIVEPWQVFEWAAKSTYLCEECGAFAHRKFGSCAQCRASGKCRPAEDDRVCVATVAVRLASGQNEDPAANAPLDTTLCFMRVTFGSDNHGPLSIMEFDPMQGTAFPIVGRRARFELVYAANAGLTQPPLDVSVSVGVGSGGSSGLRGPRRTVVVGNVQNNAATTGNFSIPPYAESAGYVSNDLTVAATLNQLVAPINGSTQIAQSPLLKVDSPGALLRQGARGFQLLASGGALTNAAVVFLLNPS